MRALAIAYKDTMPSCVPCLLACAADKKGKLGSSLSFLSFRGLETKHYKILFEKAAYSNYG